MAELESSLEGFFRKRIRLVGGHTIKLAPTEAGIPDRLVILPGGRMCLVELKKDGGALRPIQLHWHEKIRRMGVHVHIVAGRSGIVDWTRQAIAALDPADTEFDYDDQHVG